MTITLNGTTGITTPAVTNEGAYTGDGVVFADTTPSNTLVTTTGGNVGIGTSSPATKLDVNGSVRLPDGYEVGFGSANTTYWLGDSTNNWHRFYTSNTERMRISAAGGLSVGTTADPGAGAIYATGNITAYYSDERLKTKVGNIDNALDKVKQIETMVYHANDTAVELGYDASVIEVGVTAQSVQKVQPEVVVPAPVDQQYLTVRYDRLVPLLIEAIKELEAQVAELKAK